MSDFVQPQPSTPFTLSDADEALAVRLQAHEGIAWRDLLGSVPPTSGHPVAEKVAIIIRRRMQDGVEYSEMGDMIREMLHTRAEIAAAERETWPVDPEQDYGSDFSEDDDDSYLDYHKWCAKRDQWLQKQSKATLIKMVLMDDVEKEDYMNTHMDDSDAE